MDPNDLIATIEGMTGPEHDRLLDAIYAIKVPDDIFTSGYSAPIAAPPVVPGPVAG